MIHRNLQNGLVEHNQPTAILTSDPEGRFHRASTRQRSCRTFLSLGIGHGPRQLKRQACDWHGWVTAKNSHEIGVSGHLFRSLTSTWARGTQGAFWAYQTLYVLGGPASLFWGTVLIAVVMLIQYMVLAELASAYPAAGAMFTWTFKLAHSNVKIKNWANFLSWTVAMYLLISHIIFQMEDSWQLGLIFPHLTIGNWHLYTISSINLIISGAFMSLPVSRSPRLWICFAILTASMSAAVCILLLSTSNFRQSPGTIFTRLENQSQIKSNGWAFMLAGSMLAAAGAETSAHMAEETHQAELVVPRAMFFATVINYLNVLVVQICCYMVERNTFDQPSMLSLVLSHCSHRASACIFSCLLIVTWIQQISQLFASTRFVWALARDNAFPFANQWRKLSTKSQMPRRATTLLITLTILVSCFLGVSQTHVTIFIERSDSICPCDKDVLYRDGRNFWTLQQWSRPLAWLAFITLLIQMVMGGFPTEPKAAGPQFLARAVSSASIPLVALLATVSWFLYGRAHYVGPIKSITVWTTGQEVELPRAGDGIISNPTSTEEAVGRRANIFEDSIPMQVTSGSLPQSEHLTSGNPSFDQLNYNSSLC
ncbi:hypothetical protein PSHT_05283 [Puccinia striiformis]|uniref:Amino acid permease/ SLC12A domain-containing protein n=1 Tax=Puccinia striiformis TaxID=27350 RepID=A0A2S4WAY5_9BASI|nr:hypothetical protein PSHT_05283 [Puccinia striiformis]